MRVAYIFAERDRPVLRSTGHSVHVQEMCRALAELGHQVEVLAGVRGTEARPPAGVRVHQLAPRLPAVVGAALRPTRRRSRGDPGTTRRPDSFAVTSWTPSAITRDLSRVAWWRIWTEFFYRRSRRLIARERPDVLYARYVLGSSVGARLAREFQLPLILEMNASFTFPEEWWAPHSPLFPRAVLQVERAMTAASSTIVVVSSVLRDHCRALGVPDERIVVLPNAADTERFRPDPRAAARIRARHGFGLDDVVVGFIGSLKPWHGVELLLQAATVVARRDSAVRFLIAGEGPLREALQEAADQAGLGERACFTGYVTRDEAPGYIAAMDIAVAPYPRLERFHFSPIKLFEYLAVGKPVIISSYRDIAEVVKDHANGVLVPPGDVDRLADAILELAGDRDLRERLGAQARTTVEERYTWRHNAAAVIRSVERIGMGPSSRRPPSKGSHELVQLERDAKPVEEPEEAEASDDAVRD